MWDWGFALGSTTAAFTQGIALGALVQGIHIENRQYAGGWWDWLTPFSVLTGLAVVVGYGLLGATWLNLKTSGALQAKARRLAIYAGVGTLVLIGAVSLWDAVPRPDLLHPLVSVADGLFLGRRFPCCWPSAPSGSGMASPPTSTCSRSSAPWACSC